MDLTNKDRANMAEHGVKAYAKHLGGFDGETILGDFLCDLLHWADTNNHNFNAALIRGKSNYVAEVKDEHINLEDSL